MADNPPDDPRRPPTTDRSFDAAMAEYTALRAELLTHSASQNTIVGLGVTAVGLALGVTLSGSGNTRLLVVVPILTSVIILAYCGESYRVIVIGRYIREELWPFIAADARPDLPSWERSLVRDRRTRFERSLAGVVEGPLMALFSAVGLASAVMVAEISVPIAAVEVVVVIAALVGGFVLARRGSR